MITVSLTQEQIAIAAEVLGCRRTRWAVLAALEFDRIYPPIPTNSMDYGVRRGDDERYIGFGATPQLAADAAVDSLEARL